MLKFPARESYCFTLIVSVLTRQKTSKITIQNNTYCSRIEVAVLDTDAYTLTNERKRASTKHPFVIKSEKGASVKTGADYWLQSGQE